MLERDATASTAPPARVAARRHSRVRLRPVDAGLARLRALIGMGLRAELEVGTVPLRLEATSARPTGSAPARHALQLHTPGGPVAVAPSREVVRALTGIDLPEERDADPLYPLRLELAAQAMPECWFELFGAATVLAAAPDAAGPLEVALTLIQPDARLALAASLQGTGEALLQVLSRPAWQRLHAPSPLPRDWSLQVPVTLGRAELPTRECRALSAGDVVVVTQPCFDLDGNGELRIGPRNAKCRLLGWNQARLELTEWNATTTGSTMKEPTAPSSMRDDHDELDDVPVMLSFELGALELTLSELRSLVPGSVMAIAGAFPPEVAVCAGGRRIGSGELVELDGRLGVEIRRIGGSS